MSSRPKLSLRLAKFNRTRRMRLLNSRKMTELNKSPEMRALRSKQMKERMKDSNYVRKLVRSWINITPLTQRILFRRLCRAGVKGLRLEYPAGGYVLDIAHLPTKTDIECDGSFHHTKATRPRDRKRDRRLRKLGWHVLRVKLSRRSEARNLSLLPFLNLLKRRNK